MKSKWTTVQRELGKAARQLIGKRIAERRKTVGISRLELAERLAAAMGHASRAVNRQLIEGLESQRNTRTSTISIPTLYGIAACLGINPGDLLPSVKEVMEKAGISLVKKQITVERWSVKNDKDSSL